MPVDFWALASIDAIHAAGVTEGCSITPLKFCPEKPVTRAQMADFLVRSLGLEGSGLVAGDYFDDVDASAGYAGAVARLYEMNLTTGCSRDPLLFCPGQEITRAELAAFVFRALNAEDGAVPYKGYFSDVPAGAWYASHVENLRELGVVVGFADGTYRPQAIVSRAEMAAILHRAFFDG